MIIDLREAVIILLIYKTGIVIVITNRNRERLLSICLADNVTI